MNGLERMIGKLDSDAREPRYRSVITAKVTRIQDDGLYELMYLGTASPDDPEDRTVQVDARVMAPMAGKARGAFMMPDVGDEVVVAFEDGDPNQPIILGGVWNRESPPPAQAKQSPKNHVRTIVSRSGHELTFDDSPGGGKVTLRSKGGPVVVLDGSTATVKSGQAEIVLGPGGVITISGTSITLDAATVAVRGGLTVNSVPYMMHIHSGGVVPTPVGPVTGPVKGIP